MADNSSYLYIIVDAPSGRRKFKVRIPGVVEDVTGYQLKARVERSAGIPISEQILKYKDRVIGDTDTCGVLGIRNGDVLNASGSSGTIIVPFPASPTTSVAPTIMTSPLPSPRRTSSPQAGFGNEYTTSLPTSSYDTYQPPQPQSPNAYTTSGTMLSPTINLSPPNSYQPSSATYVNQASSPHFPSTIIHPPNSSTYLSPTSYNQPSSTFSSPSYQQPPTHLSQSATFTPINQVPTSSSTFVPTVVSAYGHESMSSHRSMHDPMSSAPTYTRNNDFVSSPTYNQMSPTYTSPSISRTMFYGDPGLSNVMVANNPGPRCAQCGDPLHPVHDHRVLPLCQSCQKAHYQLQALSYIQSRSRSLSW